jgi:hyperosmotically inducible protein
MGSKSLARFVSVGMLATVVAVAGCRSSGSDRTATQKFNDRMTAHHVKKALDDAPVYKYGDVNVLSYYGTVELTGFVDTQQQRENAAQIASRVQGVSRVVNDIMLKQTTPTGRPTMNDEGRETGHIQQAPIVQPNQPKLSPPQEQQNNQPQNQ